VKKICFVATIPAVVHSFLREHISAAARTYEVTVICNGVDVHLIDQLPAKIILLPIERRPSLLRDLSVLVSLICIFNREQFDIVHSHFPKTGLLGMVAAVMTQVPIRVHTFHGEVWATRTGLRRLVLKFLDKLVGLLATSVLVVSPSQQAFLVNEGVLASGKSRVLGAGSVCGVDTRRFRPDADAKAVTREVLGIDQDAVLILYVGRLNRDKGLLDLAEAFATLPPQTSKLVLLMVGTVEDLSFETIQLACQKRRDAVLHINFSTSPEQFMAAADVYCLPSYREGFGLTVIEAAACGVPTVGSRINGIIDAVIDGTTGLLFPAGNVQKLKDALMKLISDRSLREAMGEKARQRALSLFVAENVTREMIYYYDTLCARKAAENVKSPPQV
jgi:glycosyltransferase involved in cell wall biosynthesis